MTDSLKQAPSLGPVGYGTTDIEGPHKAVDVAAEAARLLEPSPVPGAPPDLAQISLAEMSFWIMDLRLKLRFRGGIMEGRDADFALIELAPLDAAMLERIADSLNYLDRERRKARAAKAPPRNTDWARR